MSDDFASTPPDDFVRLSARLGADPLRIQGPGGNTSIKRDGAMWIKASGTRLARAMHEPVFTLVDVARARAEIGGAGDGTCRAALLDPEATLRPSIETTFHALMDDEVVLHTHSVATLAHVTSEEGEREALRKLDGMGAVVVPYAKPGLPLTKAIAESGADAPIHLLRNHGLIVSGANVGEAEARMDEVERRLALAPTRPPDVAALWDEPAWRARAEAGSYWPDHVVFLGSGLPPRGDHDGSPLGMLQCLADVLARVPPDWTMRPIGPEAEAELKGWDAETYRQKLEMEARARAAGPPR